MTLFVILIIFFNKDNVAERYSKTITEVVKSENEINKLSSLQNNFVGFSVVKTIFKDRSKNNLDKIKDWKNINELIPKFYSKNEMKKTGIAGIFAASLELSKEGIVKVSQSKLFEKLMIKRT